MNEILMHSTKYDGSLHYRYRVQTIDRTDARLITFSEPGIPIESYRGSWARKHYLLSIFWIDRPYVLHVQWHKTWEPISLYTDIATGTNWRDGSVGYVDMDLDVILPHDSPKIILDDEDEFEEHRLLWKYPDDLVNRCRDAADEVRRLLEARQPPFTPAIFAWRPQQPLMFDDASVKS